MARIVIDVPAMYGDHHVVEARRCLLAIEGIEEVNASSCFHTVDVSYDPGQIEPEEIEAALEKAGYIKPLPLPVETGVAVAQGARKPSGVQLFRHTAAYEQARSVISFAHTLPAGNGAPVLWPCPGVGIINSTDFEIAALDKEATNG